MRGQKLCQAIFAERLSVGVFGFGETVRVEQETVAFVELEFPNRVSGFGQNSEQQAVAFDFVEAR